MKNLKLKAARAAMGLIILTALMVRLRMAARDEE